MTTMTNRERSELISLTKQRAKIARQQAVYKAADLLADFEAALAAEYAWDEDETWTEARRVAGEALNDANTQIADRCRELGIPAPFAPSLSLSWYSRGENASKERRAELRKVAKTRLDAICKGAQVQIERASVEVQTHLVREGLETDAAREFLETGMPTVESLMPPLSVPEVEKLLGPGR